MRHWQGARERLVAGSRLLREEPPAGERYRRHHEWHHAWGLRFAAKCRRNCVNPGPGFTQYEARINVLTPLFFGSQGDKNVGALLIGCSVQINVSLNPNETSRTSEIDAIRPGPVRLRRIWMCAAIARPHFQLSLDDANQYAFNQYASPSVNRDGTDLEHSGPSSRACSSGRRSEFFAEACDPVVMTRFQFSLDGAGNGCLYLDGANTPQALRRGPAQGPFVGSIAADHRLKRVGLPSEAC